MRFPSFTCLASLAAINSALVAAAPYSHVFAFSVDGMHSSDVEKYIAKRPDSTIAKLLMTGYEYTNAYTTGPSDSFPGSIAQYTGAGPRTTGVWYDDTWDWAFYPPSSNCSGPPGAEVLYDESIDYNDTFIFSGGINTANLPMTMKNGKCVAVAPHQRLRVNTVWELAVAAGLQTAYTDKHPAYELMRGPSGTGLTVGYFPEIAAVANNVNATIAYDQMHVNAWLDWINGSTPINTTTYGTKVLTSGSAPSLFGGNFQCVSVAEKTVGYNNDTTSSLSAALLQAFDFVDSSLGQIVAKLNASKLLDSSLIIVASKHGQAPIKRSLWSEVDPDDLASAIGVPTAFVTTDDIALIFLNKSSDTTTAVNNLMAKAKALHIQELIYGANLTAMGYGNPLNDTAVPNIIVMPTPGTCYTTSRSKIAEHGGLSDDDRHVACFASNPKLKAQKFSQLVSTRQVAMTIMKALDLNGTLEGAAIEGTMPLPGF